MQIVKAEILWSRQCKLSCPYCNMKRDTRPEKNWDQWKEGIQQLKKLDCGFCAIYGAEPLEDFNLLPEFIQELSENDILSTLITACYRKDTKKKLIQLYKSGLRSLSVSYDGDETFDKSSEKKTNLGIETLRWFKKEFSDLRDSAIIMTITNRNYLQIPDIIKKMSDEGIWTLFDFIHPDRGQNGSKCKNTNKTKSLLFTEETLPSVIDTLDTISYLKSEGYKVHWSQPLVDYIKNRPSVLINYDWHCVTEHFPSWLTVDNTGEVHVCDDFQIRGRGGRKIYIWEISDKFHEFIRYKVARTKKDCPGCIWNTHWSANAIKAGIEPFADYVHEESNE